MNIKKTELRIGNIVNASNVNERKLVIHIIESGADIDNAYCYFPIAIDEVLLLKCGFTKHNNGWYLLEFCLFDNSLGKMQKLTYNSSEICPEVKYLHQLQNLYFTLTGEELKVKL